VASLAARIARVHVPLGTEQAVEAARLFNATGRRRGSFRDCIVAATAVTWGVPLATCDRADFERFAPHGLELAT
jgi:predicted nucleic acid-binding protein